jgi:hypothetical protein
MAVAEGFMGVAAILAAVAMDGAVAVTAGVVVVTGGAGTVVVGTAAAGMDAVGTVEGMGVVGMAVAPTGGGATHTRMLTDLTVGKRTVGTSSCSSLPIYRGDSIV